MPSSQPTHAPTLWQCHLSAEAFNASMRHEVYGSCPWSAAVVESTPSKYSEDCLAHDGVVRTIEECAYGPCRTCGHYASCAGVWASNASYADCVTCTPGYELDVLYDDCTGVCVPQGVALNPLQQGSCRCFSEARDAMGIQALGSGTCAPSAAPSGEPTVPPTPFDGTTESTLLVNASLVLDGVAEPQEINLAGPRLEALQLVLVEAALLNGVHINGSRAITSINAASYEGGTRIDYAFYVWLTEAGVRNRTATDIMARDYVVNYKANLVTQCQDGTLNNLLNANPWTADYTANKTLTERLAYDHAWRPFHITEADTTSTNLDTTLRVSVTSSLKFDNATLDPVAFNADATAINQFADLISRMWPNVTQEAIDDVVAEQETGTALVRIRYAFDDYVVSHGATVDSAKNESDRYTSNFVAFTSKQATNGKLQTHITNIIAGNRRRLQTSAFSTAQADPVACAAAIETDTFSEVEVMNAAPTVEPTLAPSLSHMPSTYTPTTTQPSAAPSYAPTTYSPTLAPSLSCDTDTCWEDASVAQFDCASFVDPVQVLVAAGATTYSIREWSADGSFSLIEQMDYFEGHVNAAGMYEGPYEGAQYAVGAFTEDPDNLESISYLCRFDGASHICFDGPLALWKPNAGAVLGLNYYYGNNLGRDSASRGLYWVENVRGPSTTSHNDVALEINDALYAGGVYDFTSIIEDGRDIFDDKYNEDGKYLVGLADDASLLIIHIADDGTPDAYAVLDTQSKTTLADAKFGAAYSYRWREANPRWLVLFGENSGSGLFQLETDTAISIPNSCWNKVTDRLSAHARCATVAQLTYAGPSAESSSNDGLNCYEGGFLQPAPTLAPTAMPCLDRVCWAETGVDAFDCERHPYPVQVFKTGDASVYSVKELDELTGNYNDIYDIAYDGHINAVALYDGGDAGQFAFASMDGELCRFDADDRVCFSTELGLGGKPNVGAIIDQTYYYTRSLGNGKSTGRSIYIVDSIQDDEPSFSLEVLVEFSEDLISGKILDLAGIMEGNGVCVTTDCDGRYLLGLAKDFSLLLVRVNGESHLPEAYAYLPSTVDWSSTNTSVDTTTDGFGAAYAYELAYGAARVFFTANGGEGLFEVLLPLAIPTDCWNAGTERTLHTACSATSEVVWSSPSDPTTSNDGLNCRDGLGRPTPQPTYSQAPTTAKPTTSKPSYAPSPGPSAKPSSAPTSFMHPRWADMSVAPWDCDAYNFPLQILKEEGSSSYSLEELDAATGLYNKLFDLPGGPSHVNAAALHVGHSEIYDHTELGRDDVQYHLLASFDGYLCRFDQSSTICFDTPLQISKPNAGAISENTYFYAKSLGKEGGEKFFYVTDINTDAPVFHDDFQFKVSNMVFEGQVLDVSAVLELDDEVIEDGASGKQYLVGLAGNYEVFIARISATGEPEAYAVVPSDIVGAASERAVPGYSDAYSYSYNDAHAACVAQYDAVNACVEGQTALDDDFWASTADDDDDDDFQPTTCADVQAWLLTEPCSTLPAACGAEVATYYECVYEELAAESLGLACDLTCSSTRRRTASTGPMAWARRLFGARREGRATGGGMRHQARWPRRLQATAATAAPTAEAGAARAETGFGASFVYRNEYETRLFFASNTGAGLFELILPVAVPDECWNADKDYATHVQCAASTAALVRRSAAAEAASNDGLNCPLGGGPAISRFVSEAPTASPAPTTARPSLHPTSAPSSPMPSTAQPSLEGSRMPTTPTPSTHPVPAPTPAPSVTPTPHPTEVPTTATPTSSSTIQNLFALQLVVDYGVLTESDGDVMCQAVLTSLELAAGTGCAQVTFEASSGRRLQSSYVVTVVITAAYHPSSEDDISSRLVDQFQAALADGSFADALVVAAAGTDGTLSTLSEADIQTGVLVDETTTLLDEALGADPGQALAFTWTPTPRPTLTRYPSQTPTKAPVGSPAALTANTTNAGSKSSGGASADAAGTDAIIGSLIAVIFVGMLGYAGVQHHRQKQLELEEKQEIEAGHFEGSENDPAFACEDADPTKAVPIVDDDLESPLDSRSDKVSEAMDSDVFFHQLMEQTAAASELASLPEGSAFGGATVASEVGDGEWDAMLNDVDDEESTETWNEDLASTLLFKLAQDGCPEGFATRAGLARTLRERPDLLDMLGILGISGDEIEFFLETIEADGEIVSRSQFLRVLERWRKSDTHSDSGTVSSKGLADLPAPAPAATKPKMRPPVHPPPPGPPTPAGPQVDDDASSWPPEGADVASKLFPPASPESAQEAVPLSPSDGAGLAKLAAADAARPPEPPAADDEAALSLSGSDSDEAPPPAADDDEAPPGDSDSDEVPPSDDEDDEEAPPPDNDDDEAEPPAAGPGGAPFSPDMSLLAFTRRRRSTVLARGVRPPPPPSHDAWSPSDLFRPQSPDPEAPAYESRRPWVPLLRRKTMSRLAPPSHPPPASP